MMRSELANILKAVVLLATGVPLIYAGSSDNTATSSSCNVPGFTFNQGQLPHDRHDELGSPVILYTLPFVKYTGKAPKPYPSLAATAEACQADPACAMFTSDGYIAGAYRIKEGPKPASKVFDRASDVVQWRKMHYCPGGDCCGTWAAEDLLSNLLQPVTQTTGLKRAELDTGESDLPLPRDSVETLELAPSLLQTACIGKPAPQTTIGGTSQPGTAQCPQSCLVSCCAQLKAGQKQLGMHHFSQCAASICIKCQGFVGQGEAPASVASVMFRPYLRAKAQQQQQQQQQSTSRPAATGAATLG